jgi:hypothetical protein
MKRRSHCRPGWTLERRLAHYSRIDPISGCRIWHGAINDAGYGTLTLNGRTQRAHRLAWSVEHGPIPDRTDVCHRCDERRCINPDHLFLDSHAANMADRWRKDRARRKLAFADHRARDDVAVIRLYYRGMQMKGELTVEPFDPDAVLSSRAKLGRCRVGTFALRAKVPNPRRRGRKPQGCSDSRPLRRRTTATPPQRMTLGRRLEAQPRRRR